MRNPNTMHIDRCETAEILRLIQNENITAAEAVVFKQYKEWRNNYL